MMGIVIVLRACVCCAGYCRMTKDKSGMGWREKEKRIQLLYNL